jgi:hypothetical protein
LRAPNVAVNDITLSSSALSGSTTLPVSRNSSRKVIAAMTDNTSGSREVTVFALSRLICAHPVSWTFWPPGVATACSRSNWVSEACEYSRAVELTVKKAPPSFNPFAADAGPARSPPTNVPPGEDTEDTSGTSDSAAAYRASSGGATAGCQESPRSRRSGS